MSGDLVKRLREGVFKLNDAKTVCEANARMTLAAIAIERKDAALRLAVEALEPITSGIYWDSVEVVKARSVLAKIKESLND